LEKAVLSVDGKLRPAVPAVPDIEQCGRVPILSIYLLMYYSYSLEPVAYVWYRKEKDNNESSKTGVWKQTNA